MSKEQLKKIVDEQAEDEGLWFDPVYVTEDYLQKALRRLHAAIEGEDLLYPVGGNDE